ncbi:ABC transporter substrate-binding protein [Salinisphaera sp. LB1]|uniref:ABC transporter substrate-binding protein n=1 Tax=Salinisphaera sp. LB1 TaxID=2183911 RepID=UPI000D7065E9|nr:ABC transporter substrate-binding protein [Salinisphaera sp. LB1]AWN14547.1 Branched-chain amino acid ABC transporter, amino acid-binding protein [Salinisphaera sp. LB1]
MSVFDFDDYKINRRTLLKAGAAVGASTLFYPAVSAFAKSDNPIKIGQIDPQTGTYAALGGNQIAGARLAVDQINAKGGVMGRPLQLLVEDSAANVGQSVQKARKLVNRDKVHFLMGAVSSSVALAVSQAARDMNTIYMDIGGHADSVTGDKCSWNTFRTCSTTWLLTAGDFQSIFDKYGKRWYFITPDYSFGHALHADYLTQLKQAGGSEAGNALAPLGTTDFSSYLIKAKSANPDVLIVLGAGDDMINTLKQATQFGLNKSMGVGGPMMELEVLQSLPDAARYGMWNMEWYWDQPNVPHVADFVDSYRKANNGSTPSARSWFGFASAHALALAAEKAKSLDARKVARALEGLELPPEVALQPNKAVYRAGDHQLIGSEYPGTIKSNGKYPDLFNVADVVDSSKIARSVAEKGCKMTYPS